MLLALLLAINTTVPDTDTAYTVAAGAIVSVPSDSPAVIQPIIRIAADVPMPIGNISDNWLPHFHATIDLTSQSTDLTTSSIGQVKGVEFGAGIAQKVSRVVAGRYCTYIYGRAGFVDIPGQNAVYSVPKYVDGGIRMEDHSQNAFVEIGVGPDQRITSSSYYATAVKIRGQIPLKTVGSLNTYFVGDAALGLSNLRVGVTYLYKTTDQVRVGIMVGK